MNDLRTLERQLEQLGRELAGDADLPRGVMDRIRETRPHARTLSADRTPRRRSRWQAPLAVAASVMLCVGVWWLSRPANLYARVMAALAEAKTFHVTGWMRHIPRKWPLEGTPPMNAADRWPDGKYPVEMWHWTEADGTTRSYEQAGPVTLVRRGGDSKEYQADADLTWVYEGGRVKDRVEEFGGLGQYFAALDRPSLTKEDLGTRDDAGRRLRGLRLTQRGRVQELWVDAATNLPVRLTQKTSIDAEPMFEFTFAADEPVPAEIANYTPPASKHVRYGGGSRTNDAWRQHVADLSQRLQSQPLSGRIALWPRGEGKLFANQWSLLTADGKYWIRPLDLDEHFPLNLDHFIRLGVATEDGERRRGTWRIPKEFHELQFPRADLIHVADMPWQEWVQFALGQIGLEFVDQEETETVWIAKHDGRPLKPWQQVQPPVPYVIEGGKEQKGYVKPGVGHVLRPATLQELFDSFNGLIDRDFAADKPRIINETGLPAPPPYDAAQHGTPREYRDKVVSQFLVATDIPWFAGHESVEMARQWYAKEFGITFTDQTRPVTVHVIRRKQ
jgi:hypothetical protein